MRAGFQISHGGPGPSPGLGAAAALGAATGMRTLTGAALLANSLHDERAHLRGALARLSAPAGCESGFRAALRSPLVRFGLGAAAVGELMADKLPGIPDRIAPGPLAARALMGAALGWTVAREDDRRVAALVGGGAAVATACAAYAVRRRLTHEHGLPDFAVALLEDAAAVVAARAAVRRGRRA